jgi:hypothetical protein
MRAALALLCKFTWVRLGGQRPYMALGEDGVGGDGEWGRWGRLVMRT